MGQQRTHWPDGALCFPQGGAAMQFIEAVEGSYLCETVDLILSQFRDSWHQIVNTRERFIGPSEKHRLPGFFAKPPSVSKPKFQVSFRESTAGVRSNVRRQCRRGDFPPRCV